MACIFANIHFNNIRPVYRTSVLGTAPLKMGTRAQNFRHGTLAFCRVDVTKIGTGAEKLNVPRLSHEVVSALLASRAVPKTLVV